MPSILEDYCQECIRVIKDLDKMAPVDYKPFAWGPENECPRHFYLIPETTVLQIEVSYPVSVIPVCKVKNPQKRGG